jgi:phenylacetate-CoA ligase
VIGKIVRPTFDAVYGSVYGRLFYPAYETLARRRPTLTYLAELERSQWLSRDELEARQLAELNRLLIHAHAYVPHYRQVLDEAGVGPGPFAHLDQLARLPLLDRQAAIAAGTRRETTGPHPIAVRKVTSGSSGTPLTFGYDADSEYWRNAARLRGYGWAGYTPGTPSLHFWGMVGSLAVPWKKRTKIKLDRALRREMWVDCGLRTEEVLGQAVKIIREQRPSVMVCYTQAAVDLARYVLAHELRDWPDLRVLTGAERLFPSDRPLLEQVFGKGLFETYGSRETMLMGMESEAHEGLLVPMENIIMEILVRDAEGRTRPAEPGETGEVVVTDLHNYGMPFIRYANGDLATLGPRTISPCGRAHMRLAGIEGRTTETMYDAKGQPIAGLIFNILFSSLGFSVKQFQAVQHKDRSVTLRVVPSDKWTPEIRAMVMTTADKYLPGLSFKLEEVADIPAASGGKRKVLVVEK